MTIISIDFSILYPGICICKNFTEFKWIALVNTDVRKKDLVNFDKVNETYPNLKIVQTSSRRKKSDQYHVTERIKLNNYLELISLLISELKAELIDPKEIICSLEGISFGSSGNSLVDISQATGILKKAIVEEILGGDTDRFFIFSPSELKNALGCKGNANKKDVFTKFKEDPILDKAKSSDLHKLIMTEDWAENGDKIASPIIDMIDSYLGVVKIYNLSK